MSPRCASACPKTLLVASCLGAFLSAQFVVAGYQAEKQVGDPCRTSGGFWGVCTLSRDCAPFVLSLQVTAADVCAAPGGRLLICCDSLSRPPPPKRPHGGTVAADVVYQQVVVKRSTTTRGPAGNPWWLSEGAFVSQGLPSETPARPDRPQDGELIAFPGPVKETERPLYPPRPDTFVPSREGDRRISEIKCDEYSQQVRRNVSALPLIPNPEPISVQMENCNYNSVRLIVGGEKTDIGEFPHMAALGYRDGRNVAWNCGGSLISEYYVLTAAHCIFTGSGFPVVVRLGEYNLYSNNDGAQPVDYSIEKVIRHPDYKPPAKYNDIGLLRLSRRVIFNKFIRPACLYTKDYFTVNKTIATGWGRIDYAEDASDILLKVSLSIIDNNLCNHLYRSDTKTNTLSKGIVSSMLCAGELEGGKDTCQGDSGGPIQISSRHNQCIHYIIGITSFGKFCAGKNAPGVYTKVSYYIPWIESIVWPSE